MVGKLVAYSFTAGLDGKTKLLGEIDADDVLRAGVDADVENGSTWSSGAKHTIRPITKSQVADHDHGNFDISWVEIEIGLTGDRRTITAPSGSNVREQRREDIAWERGLVVFVHPRTEVEGYVVTFTPSVTFKGTIEAAMRTAFAQASVDMSRLANVQVGETLEELVNISTPERIVLRKHLEPDDPWSKELVTPESGVVAVDVVVTGGFLNKKALRRKLLSEPVSLPGPDGKDIEFPSVRASVTRNGKTIPINFNTGSARDAGRDVDATEADLGPDGQANPAKIASLAFDYLAFLDAVQPGG